MDMDTLQRAKNLVAAIESAEKNIKSWKELFEADEVTITSPTKKNPMYLSGRKKNEVRDLIINDWQKWLDEKKLEFKNL